MINGTMFTLASFTPQSRAHFSETVLRFDTHRKVTVKSESDPGKEIVDLVLDRLRKLADNCTGLQGTWSFACSFDACTCVRYHWKGSGRALRQREDLEARSFNARDSGTGAIGYF